MKCGLAQTQTLTQPQYPKPNPSPHFIKCGERWEVLGVVQGLCECEWEVEGDERFGEWVCREWQGVWHGHGKESGFDTD